MLAAHRGVSVLSSVEQTGVKAILDERRSTSRPFPKLRNKKLDKVEQTCSAAMSEEGPSDSTPYPKLQHKELDKVAETGVTARLSEGLSNSVNAVVATTVLRTLGGD